MKIHRKQTQKEQERGQSKLIKKLSRIFTNLFTNMHSLLLQSYCTTENVVSLAQTDLSVGTQTCVDLHMFPCLAFEIGQMHFQS